MMSVETEAVSFATEVHEGQRRKGKSDPYITHPLAVGVILFKAGASEDIIAAGILHDTIEDCEPYGSVTREVIERGFNSDIARMVDDVTEQDKSLPWTVRKQLALDHIQHMQKDSLLVKSADVLHNMSELLVDQKLYGDTFFDHFRAPKAEQLRRYELLVAELEKAWDQNPLLSQLKRTLEQLKG